MTFSYYPGCTLKTKAKDLNRYACASAEALGIELAELPDWQCCGGAYTMGRDEIATKLSSVRALASARDLGNDLITLCSACHNVLKQVNNDMQQDENIATKANNYLQLDTPYHGETKVIHYLEMLRDVVGFDEIAKRVVNPLKGKKIAAYYGCLLLAPGQSDADGQSGKSKDYGGLHPRDWRRTGRVPLPQRMLRRIPHDGRPRPGTEEEQHCHG